jgi:ketosteroid isomerase-like protein
MMTDDAQRCCLAAVGELVQSCSPRLNSGDVEGLVELYEATAILALPGGNIAAGSEELRAAFQQLDRSPGSAADALRTEREN